MNQSRQPRSFNRLMAAGLAVAALSATTTISRSCAASTAASTLAELPLVDKASSTSPAWPSARTWRANTERASKSVAMPVSTAASDDSEKAASSGRSRS